MVNLRLTSSDVLKVLDGAYAKLISAASPVKELAFGVQKLAENIQRVAQAVTVLAQNQQHHATAILQLQERQSLILRKVSASGLDMSMPDIKDDDSESDKDAKSKPN